MPAKMIAALAVLAVLGCKPGAETHQMADPSHDMENLSESIMGEQFETLSDLTRLLDGKGVRYALMAEDDTNPAIPPSSCKERAGESFRFFAMKIQDIPGPKTYRYRIYESGTGPLCVEADFAFKNPYQS